MISKRQTKEGLEIDWDIRNEGKFRGVFCTVCNETFYTYDIFQDFIKYIEFAAERERHAHSKLHKYNVSLKKLAG